MWFINTKHFGLRGCDEHRRMKWGDVNRCEWSWISRIFREPDKNENRIRTSECQSCTAPEMIPTPKWSPTLKWSPNWPRNDPHISSCRPQNDPHGLREWWLNMGLWIAFCSSLKCWNPVISFYLYEISNKRKVVVGSLFRYSLDPVSFQWTIFTWCLSLIHIWRCRRS